MAKQIAFDRGEQPKRDRIHLSLLHRHLPKLADRGIVEYDVRNDAIRYRECERLESLLERLRDFDPE